MGSPMLAVRSYASSAVSRASMWHPSPLTMRARCRSCAGAVLCNAIANFGPFHRRGSGRPRRFAMKLTTIAPARLAPFGEVNKSFGGVGVAPGWDVSRSP
eukprot:4471530-Alexandrium_andersonii.AAC.1